MTEIIPPPLPRFQACVNPSGTKCHIYRVGDPSHLVLCQTTAPAANFTGVVPAVKLCQRCMKAMVELIPEENRAQYAKRENFALVIGVKGISDI